MSHSQVQQLLTDHIDLWTTSIEHKTSAGRGSNRKQQLHGIKKLRELILELAVRGKLVPQDASDEPAAVLLERIASERDRLVKEKAIKNLKPLPPISEKDKPFEPPQGWEWSRLENIVDIQSGITKGKKLAGRETIFVPYLRVANVQRGYLNTDEIKEIEIPKDEHEKYQVNERDLLITEGGDWDTVGRTAVWASELPYVAHQNHVFKARIFLADQHELWIEKYLNSPISRDYFAGSSKQTTNLASINKTQLRSCCVAIPPLPEQHRIVAKVDELMALCDQLEQQTEQQLDAHQQLVTTLLDTLTQSQNAAELAANWARLSQHFNTLFTTDASIDLLKQTILQLAVMGKLVPQDLADEPASELLSRIAAEKEQLIKEKKIKKQKPLPAISDEEKPFELPEGWEWCRLNNLTIHAEAGWSPQCEGGSRENGQWGVLKVSAVTWGEYRPEENKALPSSLEPRPQYEVKAGDFLLSRANTADLVARAVVVPESCPQNLMMSDKIIRFKLTEKVCSEFVNLINNSQVSRRYYARVAGGTSSSMKNVSQTQVRSLLISFPPLPEQHRIVTKVNELFALCDQLKQQLQQQQRTQLLLTDTLVQDALNR